jgi:hypothetical protein
MQKSTRSMPTPVRILLIALAVGTWVAALYMWGVSGLQQAALQSLPLLYWVLLFSPPVIALISILVWDTSLFGGGPASLRGTKASVVGYFIAACAFLFLAFLNYRLTSPLGGTTALYLAYGCMFLISAYSEYRRFRGLE